MINHRSSHSSPGQQRPFDPRRKSTLTNAYLITDGLATTMHHAIGMVHITIFHGITIAAINLAGLCFDYNNFWFYQLSRSKWFQQKKTKQYPEYANMQGWKSEIWSSNLVICDWGRYSRQSLFLPSFRKPGGFSLTMTLLLLLNLIANDFKARIYSYERSFNRIYLYENATLTFHLISSRLILSYLLLDTLNTRYLLFFLNFCLLPKNAFLRSWCYYLDNSTFAFLTFVNKMEMQCLAA